MADDNQDDLLNMIFSAPINLPTVTGPDPNRKPLEHEVSSAAGSEAGSHSVDRSRQSTVSSVGRRKDSASSGSDQEEAHKEASHEEESDDEKDDSTIHGDHDETTDFLQYNGQLGGDEHAHEESLDHHSGDEKESEASEADEVSHHEGEYPELNLDQPSDRSEQSEPSERDEQEEHVEEEEEEDDEERRADKVAPLRTPQHDMIIDEMRSRQQRLSGDEEEEPEEAEEEKTQTHEAAENEYIEEDVNLGEEDASDEEGKVASVSQGLGKEEQGVMETAEAFLDYDRSKAFERESIDEPSFGIGVESEIESDQESELAKFDEEAGLNNAAAMMSLLVKKEEPHDEEPRSRTITQSSQGTQQGMHFNELSMEQHSEDRWDQPSSDFYNSNVIMKKSEAYVESAIESEPMPTSERKESESYHAPSPIRVASTDVPQRKISVKRDSIASTQTGTFEQNADVAEEVSSAPGVRNLKSLFEKSPAEKPKLGAGHPPVIQYEYEPDYREHEERKFVTSGAPTVHSVPPTVVPVAEEVAHEESKPAEPVVVVRAVEEEQKPVTELLTMFGGRKEPTPKKKSQPVQKVESTRFPPRADVERPVNVVPAVRSRASSTASVTQKTERPAKLDAPADEHKEMSPSYKPHKSPMFGGEDRFQSVRVVKNVRQFVKLWGQAAYVPGGPHPMSPVPAEMPNAHDVREMEEYAAVYKPTPKHRSSTVASIASAFASGHEKPLVHAEHEQQAQSTVPVTSPPAPMSPPSTVPPNTHHIVSEKDPLNEVMIDDVPVSKRRQMFEKNPPHSGQHAERRSSTQSGGRRVAQVKAVVRENEPASTQIADPKEHIEKESETVSRDEIEKGTEEIADYISQLTPVSERRKCFENNVDPVNRSVPVSSKRI